MMSRKQDLKIWLLRIRDRTLERVISLVQNSSGYGQYTRSLGVDWCIAPLQGALNVLKESVSAPLRAWFQEQEV